MRNDDALRDSPLPTYCASVDCYEHVPAHEILCRHCKAPGNFFGKPKHGWPLGVQDSSLQKNLVNDFSE